MRNETVFTELFLSGLSGLPQLPLFVFFLIVYLLTLTWNLLIITLIVTDSRLHTPMYFFLGNLASIDLFSSSVIVPRIIFDLLTQSRMIAVTCCLIQLFFFIFLNISEVYLLAAMSYDRYVAICYPLHYMQFMHRKFCVLLASSAWFLGMVNACVHTLYALKLTFCETNVLESFFCDLPQLLQISCSDILVNVLLIFSVAGFTAISSLTMIFLPYVFIIKTVLKLQVKGSRSKVFSTCSSHLTVVFLLYGTVVLNYFRPNARNHYPSDKVLSVFYTVINPFLNPLIYSLRNQDLKAVLQNVLNKAIPKLYAIKHE